MNDNHKTSKGSHTPSTLKPDKELHHRPSKLYQQRDIWCREGSTMYSGHRSHGWEHKIYRRVLRAKLNEETKNIINEYDEQEQDIQADTD